LGGKPALTLSVAVSLGSVALLMCILIWLGLAAGIH
jgi:hypothetical protein